VIAGRYVTLRAIAKADMPSLVTWFSDPAIFKYWGGKPLTAEAIARRYFGRRRSWLASFIIVKSARPIGYIQASRERNGDAHIDFFLEPAARGRGLGTDAIRTLVRRLRSQIRVNVIMANPSVRNVAALRALRKAGFVRRSSRLVLPRTGV